MNKYRVIYYLCIIAFIANVYESSFKHFSRASTVYFDDHLFLSGNTIDHGSSLFYYE